MIMNSEVTDAINLDQAIVRALYKEFQKWADVRIVRRTKRFIVALSVLFPDDDNGKTRPH